MVHGVVLWPLHVCAHIYILIQRNTHSHTHKEGREMAQKIRKLVV